MYNVSGAVFKPSVPGKKVVYLHRKKTDGEIFYVGYGIKSRPFTKGKRNRHWWAVVNKHGYEVEVIYENLSTEMAKNIERVFIALCGGMENLTNKTRGGEGTDGYRHTDESRKLMSEKILAAFQNDEYRKRNYEARIAACRTPEYRQKRSEIAKTLISERGHPFLGKTHTDETKKKLSINNGSRRPEVAAKISASRLGELNPNFGKDGFKTSAFKGLTIGTFHDGSILVFEGGKDMRERGMNHSAVYQCIAGKKPQYKGFTFSRTTDLEVLANIYRENKFFDEQSKLIVEKFLQA